MCLAVMLLGLAYAIGEVASIVLLGSFTDGFTTLFVLLVAGAIGLALLAGRALATLRAAGVALVKGEEIGPVIAQGALVGVAGVLFIVPGLLSDAVAIVLLVPRWRARAGKNLSDRVHARIARRRMSGEPPRQLP
jgi:UPF0716 protein FxsA